MLSEKGDWNPTKNMFQIFVGSFFLLVFSQIYKQERLPHSAKYDAGSEGDKMYSRI